MRTEAEIEARITVMETYIDNLTSDKKQLTRASWRKEFAHALRQQVCELKWTLEPEGYDPHEHLR